MNKILSLNSVGEEVVLLQKALGTVQDGEFGPLTLGLVIRFQKTNGLVPDGIVGPKTWNALFPPSEPQDETIRGSKAWYVKDFKNMSFDPGFEATINKAAQRVLSGIDRYKAVALTIGCPWYFIGALHNMEATCDFRGVLHNGEKILGTGKKTSLVPAGRGPFETWEESAIDALKMKNFHLQKDWDLGAMLMRAERYNGMGVFNFHKLEKTAYLWAQSSINDGTGKYVADGKWSETANANGQTGFAVILKELELMGKITLSTQT